MKTIIFKIGIALLLVLSIAGLGFGQNNVSTLKFDGVDDYVTISEDYLVGESNYTIEAWVRIPSGAKSKGVIVQRAGCYYVYANTNRRLSFAVRYVSGGNLYWAYYHTNNNALLADDNWHHVAVIRNTADSPTSLKLYVDGVNESALSKSGYPTRNISNRDFYIGDNGASGSDWNFEGKIDEIRLKNIAEDISSLHTDKNNDPYTTDANTEALFHFDENGGATTANAAGGSATINGATWATFDDLWFPIELLSFDATIENKNVNLDWTTLSETNNKGFEIQRSSDAKTWEVIGFVDGQGNSRGEVNYSFVDENPKPINYYRLNQKDFDGNNTYSNTLQINLSDSIGNSIYPNPTSDNLYIRGIDSNVEFEIYNKLGKLVSKGITNNKLNVSSLKNGVYFIELNNKIHKIIKM